jgi:DNA-binding CsgD family transcriptional regulator
LSLIAAARAAHRGGNLDLTKTLIGQAKSDPGYQSDPTLLLLEADMRMRVGDFAEAYGSLRLEAARIAEHDRPRATTMLLVAAKLRVYRHEGALALLEVEQALADVPESERSVVHHSALAMAQTMAGHPDARNTARIAMSEAVASPHGHIHSLGIGWPLIWLEEYERARAFLNRSAQIQRDGGFLAYLPLALLPLAELDYRTGQWNDARIHATEALRLLEESNQPTDAAFAHLSLARLDAASGDTESARHHATFGGEHRLGQTAASVHADAVLGFLELGLGNYSEAVHRFDQCAVAELRGGTREPWLLAYEADLAEALLRLGEQGRAGSVARSLVEHGEQMGRMSAVAAGHRALGLAADTESFRAEFEIALEIHRGLPTPFELARTQLAFGERLRRSRQRVEARKSLRLALGIFEDLGATVWAHRAATELEVSGEKLDNPRSLTTLTRQERQVASLVAKGATNREAAAILFVNRKTVEFHLANVYRKLGVRSRTELANVMTGERHQIRS